MDCSVCLSKNTSPSFIFNGYPFEHCSNCTHLYVACKVPPSVLTEIYDEKYYISEADDSTRPGYVNYPASYEKRYANYTHWFRSNQPLFEKPGRYLDYGCAIGITLKVAQELGWEAKGYENSSWAVEYGRRMLGVDIVKGDGTTNPFSPGYFDLVTLWDLFEHLEYPREVMERVRDWLRPGGWVAINTIHSSSLGARLAGDKWRHLSPPYHLQYFTRNSLLKLLNEYGFRVQRMRVNGLIYNAERGYIQGYLFQKIQNLLRHRPFGPIISRFDLFDEIYIMAQRG